MTHEKECCPKFNPQPWQKVTHQWNDKPFLFATIPQFLHMPLPWMYRRVISRMWQRAQGLGIAPDVKDFLLFAYDPSPWKSELYLAAMKDIPEKDITKLSGTFVSMVFDGPYSGVPKFMKEMDGYLRSTNQTSKKYFFYYTTCPKCAKKYGHNYIVALAQV
jgi:NMD protein affecting ribosome stability and mRNA decay